MRPDGRKNDELRSLKVTKDFIKNADGSVLIELGNTRVICTASIENKLPPFLKDQKKGWITAEYGMLPRATTVRMIRESTAQRVGGRTHEIQRFIGRSLRAVVDFEKLGERTIWIDCDVIEADGGTRTTSITGGYLALREAIKRAINAGMINENPIKDSIAAVSVGIVMGEPRLDLCYQEDSQAELDMNVVMTGSGKFVEIQGTAEIMPFSKENLFQLLSLAEKGIREIIKIINSLS